MKVDMNYKFQWYLITRNWQPILEGILVTYWVTILSMALCLVFGLVLALMRLSNRRWVSLIAQTYIEVVRAIPLYVFLLWIYFGLSVALKITFQPLEAGVLALGLLTSAYTAEIYRSGIMAVSRGQFEAARALGLTQPQLYLDIVFPQAFRVVLPSLANQFVGVFKGAAIVSLIGVADLMYFAREASLKYFRPFEFYSAAGALLIASTIIFGAVVAVIESKMRWAR
jgi:His/Glu/Gln/Arg/opine family amino acid ABC transporter permease subunit